MEGYATATKIKRLQKTAQAILRAQTKSIIKKQCAEDLLDIFGQTTNVIADLAAMETRLDLKYYTEVDKVKAELETVQNQLLDQSLQLNILLTIGI